MYAGQIVEVGASSLLHDDPLHPYTAALVAARPDIAHKAGRLRAIPGQPLSAFDAPRAECAFAPRCPHSRAVCRARRPDIVGLSSGLSRCARVRAARAAGGRRRWLTASTRRFLRWRACARSSVSIPDDPQESYTKRLRGERAPPALETAAGGRGRQPGRPFGAGITALLRIARSARPSLDKGIGRSYAAKRFRQLRESPSSSLEGGSGCRLEIPVAQPSSRARPGCSRSLSARSAGATLPASESATDGAEAPPWRWPTGSATQAMSARRIEPTEEPT
jgi:oligopeptide/dipeptide ABC transporter ATP-binding protein